MWLDSPRREEVLASDHSSVHPQPLPAQLPEHLASCTFSWEGCPWVRPVPLGPIRSLAAPASPSFMSLPLLGPPSSVTIRDPSASSTTKQRCQEETQALLTAQMQAFRRYSMRGWYSTGSRWFCWCRLLGATASLLPPWQDFTWLSTGIY